MEPLNDFDMERSELFSFFLLLNPQALDNLLSAFKWPSAYCYMPLWQAKTCYKVKLFATCMPSVKCTLLFCKKKNRVCHLKDTHLGQSRMPVWCVARLLLGQSLYCQGKE